jgi:hypothetical protein
MPLRLAIDHDQTLDVCHWRRIPDQALHDAEERRRQSDTDANGKHREQRFPGSSQQASDDAL